MTMTLMSTAAAPSIGGGLRPYTVSTVASPFTLPTLADRWASPSALDLATRGVDARAGSGRHNTSHNSITAASRAVAVPTVTVFAVPAHRIRAAKQAAPPRGVPR